MAKKFVTARQLAMIQEQQERCPHRQEEYGHLDGTWHLEPERNSKDGKLLIGIVRCRACGKVLR